MYVVLAHIHVDIVGDCRQFPGDSQSPETANTMYPPSMLCHRASGGYQERIMRATVPPLSLVPRLHRRVEPGDEAKGLAR